MENQKELEAAMSALRAWLKNQGINNNDAIVLMVAAIGNMLLESKDPERGFRAVHELFDTIVKKFPDLFEEGRHRKPAP